MDFKGAASKEVAALQARQQYLTVLATSGQSQQTVASSGSARPARNGMTSSESVMARDRQMRVARPNVVIGVWGAYALDRAGASVAGRV
jgi:hypothetical protein